MSEDPLKGLLRYPYEVELTPTDAVCVNVPADYEPIVMLERIAELESQLADANDSIKRLGELNAAAGAHGRKYADIALAQQATIQQLEGKLEQVQMCNRQAEQALADGLKSRSSLAAQLEAAQLEAERLRYAELDAEYTKERTDTRLLLERFERMLRSVAS